MDRDETSAARLRTGRARLRRPPGVVERARWWFTVFALAALVPAFAYSVVVEVSTRGSGAAPGPLVLALASSACLAAVWVRRYLTSAGQVLLDMVEVVATAAFALSCPHPAVVLPVAVAALWVRALYGSVLQLALFGGWSAVGVALALIVLSDDVRGRDVPLALVEVLLALPLLLLVGGAAARYLAGSLFGREQARLRDAALVRLSDQLIRVTDRETIHARSRECAISLCVATPGLRSLIVVRHPTGSLRVLDHAGRLGPVPESLPGDLLPVDAPPGTVWPVTDAGPLVEAAGFGHEWIGVPLPEGAGGWILLGAPDRVPMEIIAAIQFLVSQTTLALRTSDAHDDLTVQSRVDPLTGLINRAAFIAALDQRLGGSDTELALLFLGLDDFKMVNEGLGHAAGDELLRHVASRLRNALRPDDVCARVGGDEFAILLGDADANATAVARRLVELIAMGVSLEGGIARVGACIGIAFATAPLSADQLMQRADIARYAAKARGRNSVQVFGANLLRNVDRAAFEVDLGAATAAGQLVVHYQPIVSVSEPVAGGVAGRPGGRCVAVEALVRWQHPARGLLAPAEFIPAAERTGAIVDIGAYVLRTACAAVTRWGGIDGRLAVHVNVSAAQLTHPGFLGVVRSCVAEFEMGPKQLVLEITESMMLDSPGVRSALESLVSLGVAIAIDDFGTGYSALSTLRTLPLDIVKIDKSFIAGSPAHYADRAVVEAIVTLAARLGLRTVAEGVERVEQQDFLVAVRANAAQGYLYLRPKPAAEFAEWLRQQSAASRSPGGTVTPLEPRRRGAGPSAG